MVEVGKELGREGVNERVREARWARKTELESTKGREHGETAEGAS